jgi:capsular polysaccharide transport system permease protein
MVPFAVRGPDTAARPRPQRLRILAALVLRETAARFGRTPGGYLWAIAEPLCGILLLTAAFGVFVKAPPLGDSFMLFYATGLVPFLAYSAVAAGGPAALAANRGLLTYPVVSALDTLLARAAADWGAQAAVAVLVLPALLLWLDPAVAVAPEFAVLALLMAGGLGLSVGTANAVIGGLFPAWRQIWSILNRPLFLVSGAVFDIKALPSDLAEALMWNPVAQVIVVMRAAFYGPDQALAASPVRFLIVTLALFVLSAAVLGRNQSRIAA